MTTWAELRTDIAHRLDADPSDFTDGTSLWSDDELLFWANDGLKEIGQRLMLHRDEKSYTTVVDQAEYEMPEDMVKLYRLEYRQSSTYIVALEYSPLEQFEGVRGVLRSQGWPSAYSTWGYPGGGGKIILDRAPSESVADGLHLYYYRLPRPLVADSDPVDLPSGWERVLAHYVEMHARRKESKDQRWREAQAFYEQGVEEMRRVMTLPSDQPSYFTDAAYGRASQLFGESW